MPRRQTGASAPAENLAGRRRRADEAARIRDLLRVEIDSAELSAPSDGWVSADGTFTETEPASGGKPVYVVEL